MIYFWLCIEFWHNNTKIMDYLGIGSKKRRGFGMDDLSPTDDPFPFELNTDFSN